MPAMPAYDRSERRRLARCIGLCLLLLAELIFFSVQVDLEPLVRQSGVLATLLLQAPALLRIGIAAAIALAAMCGGDLRHAGRRWLLLAREQRFWPAALLCHSAAAIGFAALSSRLFGPQGDASSSGALIAWLIAGACTFASWCATLAPWAWWIELANRRNLVRLVGSFAIGVAVYVASLYSQRLWQPLADLTFSLVHFVLRCVYPTVSSDPGDRVLGTPTFQIRIAPECSGYEGIGMVAAALVAFFILFRKQLRFPHALALLPIGVALIWTANILRIAALVIVGTSLSAEVASGGFHSQAGWLCFSAVTVGIAVAALRMPFFSRADRTLPSGLSAPSAGDSTAALCPLMAMILAAMISAAFSAGFDWLYAVRMVVGTAVLKWYWNRYDFGWRGVPWAAIGIGVAVFALWIALLPWSTEDGAPLAAKLARLPRPLAAAWIVARAAGSTLVVPLAEELAFRGFLMRRFTRMDFETVNYAEASWQAVLGSSLLFGLLHGRWFAGALAGVAYAWAARRRNSLGDAVAAHAVTNGLIAATVIAFGEWRLWS